MKTGIPQAYLKLYVISFHHPFHRLIEAKHAFTRLHWRLFLIDIVFVLAGKFRVRDQVHSRLPVTFNNNNWVSIFIRLFLDHHSPSTSILFGLVLLEY